MSGGNHLSHADCLIFDWGLLPYEQAYKRQLDLVEQRVAGLIDDCVIVVEHPPVFTIGARIGASQHLLWADAICQSRGIDVVHTNRGGDITCHAPGQLVVYPIISLQHSRDLHAYLRFLEEWIICICQQFEIQSERRLGQTGIWIQNRKIAAIGVAARQWVTYHGWALNVSNDLMLFDGIIPCGIQPQDGTVTSLSKELGYPVQMKDVKKVAYHAFKTLAHRHSLNQWKKDAK